MSGILCQIRVAVRGVHHVRIYIYHSRQTRDRIASLRPDMGRRVKEYLALRDKVELDGVGTPLFSALGNRRGGKRLSRRHIRVQTDGYLRKAGLKRPGISDR